MQHKWISDIELTKSLFKGREDVFARHWQKGSRKGYMPAYQFDPYMFRLHKMKGGTFKSYEQKTFLPLSDKEIKKHLQGEQLIGIYPLLQDNTSWFIAADFDGDNWAEECLKVLEVLKEKGISAYLERSRSGNGGHVWIFFDRPYPAIRSRKLFKALLEKAGVFSLLDKTSSFDRLFPNQDALSGKGLGNLIALPFYRPALERGNSCFVDKEMKSFEDQWKFLSEIERVEISLLDQLLENLSSGGSIEENDREHSGIFTITLENNVVLDKWNLPPSVATYLKDELNFANSEFFIKKKTGKSTWGTDRYFQSYEETSNALLLPRGFIGNLIRFCREQQIDHEFIDKRKKPDEVEFSAGIALRDHQKKAVSAARKKDFGVIIAPPGSGKTIIGLQIIAEKKLPALIVVHRKQLMEQWMERIESFLGIPKKEIGRIGQGKARTGKLITVAMIQSLGKQIKNAENSSFTFSFGTVIIDECHHIPAETYKNVISQLTPYFQYGLTATPFRKGSDGKIIFTYLGDQIALINSYEIENYKRARVVVRNTSLDIPYNGNTDPFEVLSKVLVHDSERNRLICKDVTTELQKGKKVVLLTERKEHIDILYQFLKQSFETITLSGDDSEASRNLKWKSLKKGDYQALITTGQFFGEGSDLQNASCLFLVYPFSFKGKLIQYIGRVQRSELTPVIYDYRDQKIDYLNKLFLKRNNYYRHLDRQATLFDEKEPAAIGGDIIRSIDREIKVLWNDLDFRFGVVAFSISIAELDIEVEFEVENDLFRPEFDVLKPYFAKVLGAKKVQIKVSIEAKENEIISQMATSNELEQLNGEIIQSVKFRFIEKIFFGKVKVDAAEGESDSSKIEALKKFFGSEEELLQDLLTTEKYKHSRQLKYLASRHEHTILKLRFVLDPFSFVFLLSGAEQYHIVLETLDTEEATYVWHFNKHEIQNRLTLIDKDLNLIRNKGRQIFLEEQPTNFSRIFHDYSDERKGFVVWKDILEERLV